ncbi:unnamed protein product [Vitrella brassicaformis CCMP3155]|uniref:Protein kinase domain-containing protein n=1 Tax=Vitrella brassicaformis (strain CCMP3155) TaxID=1169540 RepID=A0A0G4E8B8_VITBC|nr:unnamed protein product [Vitrella brassicaformis CCMP3155]|eukprot:CEL91655.1 unnamed protein product [Vitrella brassicaformis CCMP3155]
MQNTNIRGFSRRGACRQRDKPAAMVSAFFFDKGVVPNGQRRVVFQDDACVGSGATATVMRAPLPPSLRPLGTHASSSSSRISSGDAAYKLVCEGEGSERQGIRRTEVAAEKERMRMLGGRPPFLPLHVAGKGTFVRGTTRETRTCLFSRLCRLKWSSVSEREGSYHLSSITARYRRTKDARQLLGDLTVVTKAVAQMATAHDYALEEGVVCVDAFANNVMLERSWLCPDPSVPLPEACQGVRMIDLANSVCTPPTDTASPPTPPPLIGRRGARVPMTKDDLKRLRQIPTGTRWLCSPEHMLLNGGTKPSAATPDAVSEPIKEAIEDLSCELQLAGALVREGLWVGEPAVVWSLCMMIELLLRAGRSMMEGVMEFFGIDDSTVPLQDQELLMVMQWDKFWELVVDDDGRPLVAGEPDTPDGQPVCPLDGLGEGEGLPWVDDWVDIIAGIAAKGLVTKQQQRGTVADIKGALSRDLDLLSEVQKAMDEELHAGAAAEGREAAEEERDEEDMASMPRRARATSTSSSSRARGETSWRDTRGTRGSRCSSRH